MDHFERIEITSRRQWRQWLEEHHTRKEGVWVVSYKKHCGDRYVDYDSQVEEALCFGWIDSHGRRVDDDRTSLLFSPRRPGSPWSGLNKRRIKALLAGGQITPAGLAMIEAAKADGSWTIFDEIEAGVVPDDLAAALAMNPAATANWERITPSSKKVILWWIKSAKTAATREKRIAETVAKAAEGRKAAHPASQDLI